MSTPPIAAKKPQQRIHHNDVHVDNYEWMRDKDNPEVIAHLDAENAYTDRRTTHLELLQEQIFEEIKGRTQETDLSVPVRRGEWWYYTRTVEDRNTASTAGHRSRTRPTGCRRLSMRQGRAVPAPA